MDLSNPVLSGLIRKRQELVAELQGYEAKARAIVAQVDALDATVRLFSPTLKITSVRVRPTPRRMGVQPGDTTKLVFELLRQAGHPLTHRELLDRIMEARGMNDADQPMREAMRNRTGSSLRGMRKRGSLVTVKGADGAMRWWVAE